MNALFESHPPPSRSIRHTRTGTSRILYAEDEPAIRRFSTLALTHSGYAVTAVEDGEQAWDALHAEPFDLLITDNDMPRLTGVELVTKARLGGIDLPVIVTSGSVGLFTGGDLGWLRLATMLQKPFTTDDLLDSVQRVLRAAASVTGRREVFSPAFAEAAAWIEPMQHWGINE